MTMNKTKKTRKKVWSSKCFSAVFRLGSPPGRQQTAASLLRRRRRSRSRSPHVRPPRLKVVFGHRALSRKGRYCCCCCGCCFRRGREHRRRGVVCVAALALLLLLVAARGAVEFVKLRDSVRFVCERREAGWRERERRGRGREAGARSGFSVFRFAEDGIVSRRAGSLVLLPSLSLGCLTCCRRNKKGIPSRSQRRERKRARAREREKDRRAFSRRPSDDRARPALERK
jgi:hypothetical protein